MKAMWCFAALGISALAAQPCAAAEDYRTSSYYTHATGAFAGATLKLAGDGKRQRIPGLQLDLGIGRTLRPSGSAAAIHVPGVGLRLTPAAKPHWLVGGQAPASIERRLGFGAGSAVLAVGALAAGAVLAAGMSGSSPDEQRELDRRQCFLPEKELCR